MPRGASPTDRLVDEECPACLGELADDIDLALAGAPRRDRRWRTIRPHHRVARRRSRPTFRPERARDRDYRFQPRFIYEDPAGDD